MKKEIPESKWERSLVGGKTAAQVGGKYLKYLAKKPFLSAEGKRVAKDSFEKDYAKTVFDGLVMLKGTALKIAQMASLELDLVPESIRHELEKSYHQVPPLNRALVRRVIRDSFGQSPETVFQSFDLKAFAAASLGQVHRAVTHDGRELAVKIQYPGIEKTIKSDIQLVKSLLKPLPDARLVMPVLDEIQKRLEEEIDYRKEADNIRWFFGNLKIDGVQIPMIAERYCTPNVICADYLDGLPLDDWIETRPDETARNKVAGLLYDIFLKSFFELHCIHADPNPGNFLVYPDNSLGLVDFGCVKRFSPDFVADYHQLTQVIIEGDLTTHIQFLKKMNLISEGLDPVIEKEVVRVTRRVAKWYVKLYENEFFDFAANSKFFSQGKRLMMEFYKIRKYFTPNPEFIFLDRTHYGLLRIFERLQATVRIRNPQKREATPAYSPDLP